MIRYNEKMFYGELIDMRLSWVFYLSLPEMIDFWVPFQKKLYFE